MKTFYALLIAVLAVVQGQAQDRSRTSFVTYRSNGEVIEIPSDERSNRGLVLVSSSRHRDRQYRSLNRPSYWSSRVDRYWAKCERTFSRDFGPGVLRSTRNLSRGRNDWSGDRYSTHNGRELKRKEGLIKIN